MVEGGDLDGKFVVVMGGGKFGTNALKYFSERKATVLIVDLNPNCLAKTVVTNKVYSLDTVDIFGCRGGVLFVGDAVKIVLDVLERKVPDLIVTAIPGNSIANLVYTWLVKRGYKVDFYNDCIYRILENLPKSIICLVGTNNATIATSYMFSNMYCIENCLPPKGVCAKTGRPKPISMDKFLEFSVYNIVNMHLVIRSFQLTHGLGAIKGEDLKNALGNLENLSLPCIMAIGTACDCHGIISVLNVE